MRVADVGIEHHVRPGKGAEMVHFAEMIDAELQHRKLMLGLDAGKRKRKADGAVLVSGRLVQTKAPGKHRGDHLLGRRLPDAAGNADNGDGDFGAKGLHDRLDGFLHVGDYDDGALHAFRDLLRQCAGSARGQNGGDIAVPVRLLAAVGHKHAAGRGRAAVTDDAADLHILSGAKGNRAAADRGGLGYCNTKHEALQETTSSALNGSPHSGQNFGGCVGSAGVQPHLSHLYWSAPAGFFAPHSMQNLPWFFVPQLVHTQ